MTTTMGTTTMGATTAVVPDSLVGPTTATTGHVRHHVLFLIGMIRRNAILIRRSSNRRHITSSSSHLILSPPIFTAPPS